MNTTHQVQTGGYPLKGERLAELETAYSIFNSLGDLAGNKAIIKGCEVVGSTTTDGFVYINGELFEFRGGQTQTSVRILEENIDKAFQNGDIKTVYKIRYVTFASGTGSIPWSEFTRLTSIIEMQKRLLPIGIISMWSGAIGSIPTGWQLCDGTNGTPNLKGRFIVGYDPDTVAYDAIGKVGGSNFVTPSGTLDQKSVNVTVPRDGWGTTGGPFGSATSGRLVVGSGQNENGEALESLRAAGGNKTIVSTNHNHAFTGSQHENRPPYYTLAYIIYTGN
ncbi:MAG TPA: hypothetical protein DHV22_08110 [Xanthomarina gelatinilytica]|uniref:Phage tail collar domain-containing protein n=1 Tax=Xanthomarina gelatinilytica TaxID=1137281 RepID=A0A3D6BQL9_9FLAO|nr:hypothetical protein [Xanthomarina gelatinilytica]